jgi:hypothetical protein
MPARDDKERRLRRILRILRVFSLAVLVTSLLLNGAMAAVVSLNPVADAYIREFSPDINFGGEPTVVSGLLGDRSQPQAFEIRRALLRFDLTGQVPAGVVIQSATLTLTVTMIPMTPANSVFDVRRVLQSWTEGGVTWNSRQPGAPWQVPGVTGSADSAAGPSSSVFVTGTGQYPFPVTASLTADVQAWADNPAANFGWLLISEDESTPRTARHFGAREDPANAPVLVIDYSLAPLAITTQPQDQSVVTGESATFNVAASGAPPLSYQWFFATKALAGQTSGSLVLNNVQTNQAGGYSVVVSNPSGSVTSRVATLTVSPPGPIVVSITSPTNGEKFPANASVTLAAAAGESNGTISYLEFLLGTNSLGIVSNSSFALTTNLPAGSYVFTARAVDGLGNTNKTSITFSIFDAPALHLTAPPDNSRFALGANLVAAAVTNRSASIARVDFLAASTNLGTLGPVIIGSAFTNPYSITWVPATPGDYVLTATAVDEFGQTGQSAPVHVRIFIQELIPPTLAITNGPGNFAVIRASPIELEGTASDNIGLDHVEFQINSGPLLTVVGTNMPAEGTTAWRAEVPVQPGKNAVRLRSVDLAGNKSPDVVRFYTYVVHGPLEIVINGHGTVAPNLNGRSLELGKTYTVTARPGPGQVFTSWTGAANTNSAHLSFVMTSNLVLVANFIPSPFTGLAGAYTGLFLDADTNRFRPESSGLFRLQVARSGAFSGKVVSLGVTYPFRGQFDPSGKALVGLTRPSLAPLALALSLDLSGATNGLQGTVTNASGANLLTSTLLAERNVFSSRNPAPQAGRHLFVLQDAAQVVAMGVASVTAAGAVRISGKLSGAGSFSMASAISQEGNVPFYLSLGHGGEEIIGWFLLGDQTNPMVGGQFYFVQAGVSAVTSLEASPAPH